MKAIHYYFQVYLAIHAPHLPQVGRRGDEVITKHAKKRLSSSPSRRSELLKKLEPTSRLNARAAATYRPSHSWCVVQASTATVDQVASHGPSRIHGGVSGQISFSFFLSSSSSSSCSSPRSLSSRGFRTRGGEGGVEGSSTAVSPIFTASHSVFCFRFTDWSSGFFLSFLVYTPLDAARCTWPSGLFCCDSWVAGSTPYWSNAPAELSFLVSLAPPYSVPITTRRLESFSGGKGAKKKYQLGNRNGMCSSHDIPRLSPGRFRSGSSRLIKLSKMNFRESFFCFYLGLTE